MPASWFTATTAILANDHGDPLMTTESRSRSHSWRTFSFIGILLGFAGLCETVVSQDPILTAQPFVIPADEEVPPMPSAGLLPSEDDGPISEDDSEVMLRGPVHEAFAEQVNADPSPGLLISAKPPEPIEELPPDVRPDGRTVEWISGYWAWDEDTNDFMWVSGIWREVPQGFRWLPGYWAEVDGGYQWVSGTWVSTQVEEIEYLQTAPPVSLDQGPVGSAPTAEHIWVPGCWNWTVNRYAWRPGYWSGGYSNWLWIPARYNWTPRGYYYCNGYWDYPLTRRGVLFAPVRFNSRIRYRRNYRFTPRVVVASNLLSLHFWVRPRYQHYYFGNYYGSPYVTRGLLPWHQYQRQCRGADPLFNHYSLGRKRGDAYNTMNVQFSTFVNNPNRRPPQTFREQDRLNGIRPNGNGLQPARMGNRLDDVVRDSGRNLDGLRFVKLENDQRQRLKNDADHVRDLVSQRRSTENILTRGGKVGSAAQSPEQSGRPSRAKDQDPEKVRPHDQSTSHADKANLAGSPKAKGVTGEDRPQPGNHLKAERAGSGVQNNAADLANALKHGSRGHTDSDNINPDKKVAGSTEITSERRSADRPERLRLPPVNHPAVPGQNGGTGSGNRDREQVAGQSGRQIDIGKIVPIRNVEGGGTSKSSQIQHNASQPRSDFVRPERAENGLGKIRPDVSRNSGTQIQRSAGDVPGRLSAEKNQAAGGSSKDGSVPKSQIERLETQNRLPASSGRAKGSNDNRPKQLLRPPEVQDSRKLKSGGGSTVANRGTQISPPKMNFPKSGPAANKVKPTASAAVRTPSSGSQSRGQTSSRPSPPPVTSRAAPSTQGRNAPVRNQAPAPRAKIGGASRTGGASRSSGGGARGKAKP